MVAAAEDDPFAREKRERGVDGRARDPELLGQHHAVDGTGLADSLPISVPRLTIRPLVGELRATTSLRKAT